MTATPEMDDGVEATALTMLKTANHTIERNTKQ